MDEPGHPVDLKEALRNWLEQARSPIGSLPSGTDPIDWAIKQFISYWEKPARQAIQTLEISLGEARRLCEEGASHKKIRDEIDDAFLIIGEDLRGALALYEWNDDNSSSG